MVKIDGFLPFLYHSFSDTRWRWASRTRSELLPKLQFHWKHELKVQAVKGHRWLNLWWLDFFIFEFLWLLVFFFFFFFCLGFIAKILLLVFCLGFIDDILLRWLQNFSSVIYGSSVYCWVVVLGLGWWWVDEKERKTERRRTKMKREERREKKQRDFFILFYSVIYIILIYCK